MRFERERVVARAPHARTHARAHARWGAVVLVWAGILAVPRSLAAQARAPERASVAAEGPYARYTAFPCEMSYARVATQLQARRRLTWRDRWPRTPDVIRQDSLANEAIKDTAATALRRCLIRHPVATAPPPHVIGIGLGYAAIGDTAQAGAAFARALQNAEHAPLAEQAWLLGLMVNAYLEGAVPRYDLARQYMARLDALGPSVAGRQTFEHNALYQFAKAIDSLPLMEAESEAALKASRQLTGDALIEWIEHVVAARINHADLTLRRGRYDDAVEELTKAGAELKSVRNGAGLGRLYDNLARMRVYGKPVPPARGHYIYVPGQSAPVSALVRPTPGKVSLLVMATQHWLDNDVIQRYRLVQQIKDTFGDSVEITLVGQTSGSDGGRLIGPDSEAVRIRDFYWSYMRLPVPLILWRDSVTGRRDDGLLLHAQNPNCCGFMTLVDKRGTIVNVDGGAGWTFTDARWMHLIAEAIRATVPPPIASGTNAVSRESPGVRRD